jgi:coproporphyrinogen III oxidase-like Fe-S oxidoreductase
MFDALLGAAFRHAAGRAMRFAPSEGIGAVPATAVSAYLHVPFCEVLCPYCSFHRVRFEQGRARRYFAAVRREIERYRSLGVRFDSLSIGGGTPTVLPEELAETIALFRALNPAAREISVETNPKDLREEVISLLAAQGVQRVSVGVQSFDDRLLGEMLRLEKYGSRAQIMEHLGAAAGRFRTLNVDMIWRLPGQTEAMLMADIDAVLESPANQASFYPLMTSRATARRIARTLGRGGHGSWRAFYQRIQARLYPAFRATSAWCFSRGGQGIDEYIVNAPSYVGLGSGAFSFVHGNLYATPFSIQEYVERIDRGLTGVVGERRLDEREALRYELLVSLMGLRLSKSVVRARHGERFERVLAPELAALRVAGMVEDDAGGWALTARGMYLWVRMMAAFFESVDEFREQMRRNKWDELGDAPEATIPVSAIRLAA